MGSNRALGPLLSYFPSIRGTVDGSIGCGVLMHALTGGEHGRIRQGSGLHRQTGPRIHDAHYFMHHLSDASRVPPPVARLERIAGDGMNERLAARRVILVPQ